MMYADEKWRGFFENKNLVRLIEGIASKYGKTPSEIMDMSLFEFSLNSAIFVIATEEELKEQEEALTKMKNTKGKKVESGDGAKWSKLGIKHKTVKKSDKKAKV